MNKNIDRPKIGLALSGGAGKAIAHISVLEVFEEAGIPVDFIVACSSAAVVAGSYACGTMAKLKEDWLRLNRRFLRQMGEFKPSEKGLFNVDKGVEWAKAYLGDRNLEDMRPPLGFTCVDVLTGEPFMFTMGSMLRALRAACAVPGLIEPVEWGRRRLVDGGLFSIIPAVQVREMGADIVIGVDIAAARYGYTTRVSRLREGYNFLRGTWPVRLYAKMHTLLDRAFTKSINYIFYSQSDLLEEASFDEPGILGILGKAMDISNRQRKKYQGYVPGCDYLIMPKVRHIGKIDFETAESMLREGRRAAEAAVPDVKKIIGNYQWKRKQSS